MHAVTFDCTVLSSEAARFMPPSRATASNVFRSAASMVSSSTPASQSEPSRRSRQLPRRSDALGCLLGRDVGRFHDLAPLLPLIDDELGELVGTVADHPGAGFGREALHGGKAHGLRDLRM